MATIGIYACMNPIEASHSLTESIDILIGLMKLILVVEMKKGYIKSQLIFICTIKIYAVM